jgi:hypothetical protein
MKKVLKFKLSQSGTEAPVPTYLENTFAGVPIWCIENTGFFIATLDKSFGTQEKFWASPYEHSSQSGDSTQAVQVAWLNENQFAVYTRDGLNPANEVLLNTSIEINVFL